MEFAFIDSAQADSEVIFFFGNIHMNANGKTNCYLTSGKVAILIDGGFFIKRIRNLCDPARTVDAEYIVKLIRTLCNSHAQRLQQQIYRIFFYDCPPFETGIHNPLTGKFIKFNETDEFRFKTELFIKLRVMRKMALRIGRLHLNKESSWQIRPEKVKELLAKKITVDNLNPEKDIMLNLRQKQVDMKIGVDITSMVLKHQVESIVLVAGDGDFVPASKLARREGVDFILDPMWAPINPDLNEHVDAVNTVLFKKK